MEGEFVLPQPLPLAFFLDDPAESLRERGGVPVGPRAVDIVGVSHGEVPTQIPDREIQCLYSAANH